MGLGEIRFDADGGAVFGDGLISPALGLRAAPKLL